MRLALTLMATCAGLAAAPGDITGASVETNGWQLLVWVEVASTNGTYQTGVGYEDLAVGHRIYRSGSERAVLTLTSPSWTTAAATTTLQRESWATRQVRFPYPHHAYPDTVVEGGRVRLRLALAEWVYAGDTDITATFLAGLYSAGGVTSAAAAGLVVTNLSQAPYPSQAAPAVANWSRPEHQVWNGGTMELRVVGFSHHADDGRPLRLVRFITTDSAGTSVTNDVTDMSIRQGVDVKPTGEYIADVDTSGLVPGYVRSRFLAYPWVGDTFLDSATTATQWPTPEARVVTNAVHFAQVRAIVSAAGNDSTGVAASEAFWVTNAAPSEFATIGGALRAIYATNLAVYARGNYGGGIIYLRAGNWTVLGSPVTAAQVGNAGPQVTLTITRHPDVPREAVIITGPSGDVRAVDGADMWTISDVTIDTSSSTLWSRFKQLVFHNVHLRNATGPALYQQTDVPGGNVWWIGCTVEHLAQGLKPYVVQHAYNHVIGCAIVGDTRRVAGHLVMGNIKGLGSHSTCILSDRIAGATWPIGTPIIYNNEWYYLGYGGNNYLVGEFAEMNGVAFVQNLFESVSSNWTPTTYTMGSESLLNQTNFIIWNNVVLGARNFMGYSTRYDDPSYRVHWDIRNNVWDRFAIKSDPFTGDWGASSTRIGNWPVIWSVNASGNVYLRPVNMSFGSDFETETIGPGSFKIGDSGSPPNFAQWTRLGAFDGALPVWADGFGDYHFAPTSPIPGWTQTRWVLPFDAAGAARSENDPPGIYAAAGGAPPPPPPPPPDPIEYYLELHVGEARMGTAEEP